MSLTSIDLELEELLNDPLRRQEFFESVTQDEVASQIRELRKERGLTQIEFGRNAGMKQSAVSRLEQADYAAWNWATLVRVANALNARWKMILQPAEEAVQEFLHADPAEEDLNEEFVDVNKAFSELIALDAQLRDQLRQNLLFRPKPPEVPRAKVPASNIPNPEGTLYIQYGQ